jgi:RNA polymerase sigma-70 factor (ECF subfamily)
VAVFFELAKWNLPASRILETMIFRFRQTRGAPDSAERAAAERALRLRRIFDETHDLAWRVLRRFGVPASRVEDAFQQVYLVISERLDDILSGRERSFVYGVAIRVARSHMRQLGRELLGDEPDLRMANDLGSDVLVDRQRLLDLCDTVLNGLEPSIREVFVLYELEGLRGVEIAELLGIPEGTAHSRLRRARIQVREAVEALGTTREVSRG